jgi:uncharacterized RDD family membrane protein YckC
MSEREPAVLRDEPAGGSGGPDTGDKTDKVVEPRDSDATVPFIKDKAPAARVDTTPGVGIGAAAAGTATARAAGLEPPTRVSRRDQTSVWVVGFWKRLVAAVIDLGVVVPAALLITLIVSKVAGVRLPNRNMRVVDVDMWIDLVLASDPALVMGVGLFVAVGMIYLLVMHITLGRTLGMRVLRMKVIDVYGDRPSPARCVARCAGYLAGVATLFLGFLWIGFDSEKRGLQDWIAGTYVIKAT